MKPSGYLVMGVAGCGKSTLAKMLAERLGWKFYDADGFHTPEAIEKMKSYQNLLENRLYKPSMF
jgi:gluconokinase